MSSENLWKPLVFDIFSWLNGNRTSRIQSPASRIQRPASRVQRPTLPIDFDIEVITSHGKLTNQEIIAEINDDVNEESDGEEEDPSDFEPINKSRIEDAREALQVLEDFSLFSKFGESMLMSH